MKFKINRNSLGGLLINLALVIGTFLLLSFTFFYGVLPRVTNKNKVVTVPDIRRLTLEQAKRLLVIRELSFEVIDSAYNADVEPYAVLEQFPLPLAKVKINRKIQLRLNAKNAPLVVLPDVTGSSFDQAQKQLSSQGIKIENVHYRPDIAVNAVLEVLYHDKAVLSGQRIPMGSQVDVWIGSSSDKPFPLPDFTGMPYDEAEVYLLGLNFKIEQVHNVIDSSGVPNSVQKQLPSAGEMVNHYDEIELWVYNRDTLK